MLELPTLVIHELMTSFSHMFFPVLWLHFAIFKQRALYFSAFKRARVEKWGSPPSFKLWMTIVKQPWHKQPVAPFSVRAFCTISSSSGPLKVHFVWEALSVFCSACTKWCGNWLVFLEKVIFRLCFHAILTENYVKFNIVWNRLCPHNMCHRIKIGKRKRGLRGIFIIIFVQNLSKSVRI